jgi:ubiquinone/menaquinone biosynthesis C-methylase UbiE
MIPERLRHNPIYRVVSRVRDERAFRRTLRNMGMEGHFDPELKRRYLRGERFTREELEHKYDRIWEKFRDDCVTGDDLATILSHLRDDARTCLEVGAGGGRVAIAVARTGREVTGVDISGEALKYAAAAAADAGVSVRWEKAAIEALPFGDDAFDVVMCSHTLEHVQDLGVAVGELLRVAAKQVIVIVPREDKPNVLSTDYHFQYFPDAETLAAAIPLADHECFVAKVDNEQWHGEYVFFAGNVS